MCFGYTGSESLVPTPEEVAELRFAELDQSGKLVEGTKLTPWAETAIHVAWGARQASLVLA
jgi:isopentenyldiphosphate isomerase